MRSALFTISVRTVGIMRTTLVAFINMVCFLSKLKNCWKATVSIECLIEGERVSKRNEVGKESVLTKGEGALGDKGIKKHVG
mgnify:CR=1 FL=1